MKLKFCCDNGANIHSERSDTFDTELDFHLTDEEWLNLDEKTQYKYVGDWALEHISWWWEKV